MDNKDILGNDSLSAAHVAYLKKSTSKGREAMELQTLEVEVSTSNCDVEADVRQVIELAAHELALVGGGTANVSWL